MGPCDEVLELLVRWVAVDAAQETKQQPVRVALLEEQLLVARQVLHKVEARGADLATSG